MRTARCKSHAENQAAVYAVRRVSFAGPVWIRAILSILAFATILLAIDAAALSQTFGNQPSGSLSDPAAMAHDRDRSRHLSPANHARALKLFDGAFSLYQAGDFDAARAAFERGLGIDPGNGPANFYLGDIAARTNETENARARYTRARFFDPDSPEAFKAQAALGSLPPPPPPEPPTVPMAAGLRDCAQCPPMARIPAGHFVMGSSANERERYAAEWARFPLSITPEMRAAFLRWGGPRHAVSVPAFRLGIYPVTFAEWDACVDAGGCGLYRPKDIGWGRGQRPVINVTRDDALAYIGWLSSKTGRHYRLPTEAEWEYAARAGTTTYRYWGEDIGIGNANCTGCGSFWDANQHKPGVTGPAWTAPVGQFRPNAFGLYDMLGNVAQMVEDCWHFTFEGAPTDGSAWRTGCQIDYVTRGGFWNVNAFQVRIGWRGQGSGGRDDSGTGFRVARDE